MSGSADKPDKKGKSGFGRTEKRQDNGHDCLKYLTTDPGTRRPPYCSKCGRPL